MAKEVKLTRYTIKKELGCGGMSRVFLAYDKKLKRSVALKILLPSLAENPKITKRFIKEARIAAQLQQSNIINIYDVGKQKEFFYIAMEYLKSSLKDRIKKGTSTVKPEEALNIIKEIAKALSYAHNSGFIHRDIKPDNIMFRDDGAVVLVDFGIVKAINSETQLTRTGMSVGTPKYMSPEQIRGKKIDGRADIYSLGIVFYEVLTGKVPYADGDVIAIAKKHVDDPVPSLPRRLKEFQPLIDKMLDKNPKERVKNAEGLVRLIEAMEFKLREERSSIVEKSKTVPKSTKKQKRGFKSFFIFLIMVLIILTLIYIFFFLKSDGKKDEESVWQNARKTDTIESYNHYLSVYPEGKYINPAKAKVNKIKKKGKASQEYRRNFLHAKEYFRQGDYDEAMKKISAAKKIVITEELNTLEKSVRTKMEEKRHKEYIENYNLALRYLNSGNLKIAMYYLEKAKQIKVTRELDSLEQRIKKRIKNNSN